MTEDLPLWASPAAPQPAAPTRLQPSPDEAALVRRLRSALEKFTEPYTPREHGEAGAADAPPFDGATYDHARDHSRLAAQLTKVREAMADHQWHTLAELAAICDAPEASVSSRLRDFRKARHGNLTVERKYISKGLWAYRMP